jgi:hypothetical protein
MRFFTTMLMMHQTKSKISFFGAGVIPKNVHIYGTGVKSFLKKQKKVCSSKKTNLEEKK